MATTFFIFKEELTEKPIESMSYGDVVANIVGGGLIGMIPGLVIYWSIGKAISPISKRVFPEDTLNVCLGKSTWQSAGDLKSNLFWGVLVAVVIAFLVPTFFNFIQ